MRFHEFPASGPPPLIAQRPFNRRMPMRSIVFTGVKGVGKSTLVSEVAEIVGLPHKDYADLMLAVMGCDDKDKLQELTPVERRVVITRVEEFLRTNPVFDGSNDYLLLENHLSTTNGGAIQPPIVAKWSQFWIAGLCVIFADPDEIVARRRADKNRKRQTEETVLVRAQQEQNAIYANTIAERFEVPLKFIANPEGSRPTVEAAQWVRSILSTPQ